MLRKFLPRLFFSLWYYRRPPWDTGISPPELMTFIQNHPTGRALDLGCGTGTNALALALHGWNTVGVDFAPRAIAIARKKAQEAGVEGRVELLVEDVTRLNSISGTFDLILDIGCFHNVQAEGRTRYMNNLERLLEPGGTFLLYGFLSEAGSDHGISDRDVHELTARFPLEWRQVGTDRRRPSAWFQFRRAG